MGRKKEKHCTKVTEVAAKKPTVMRFLMEELCLFHDKLYVCQAEKFNWTAHFYRGRFYNDDYLIFDIYCHCHISNWSCDAKVEVKMWNRLIHNFEHHFELKKNCISCPPFMKWKDLIAPENNHVRNGRVVCEIYITELPKKVQRRQVLVKKYPGICNLEILIGKFKFHVNKELLAFTSKFFDKELKDGKLNSSEPYTLTDIIPIDFRLYLDLTYHPKQYFSAYHAKDILRIAKKFENTEVVTTCQNVIVEDLKENKLSSKDKAKLAETYDLDTIKELFSTEALLRPTSRPRFMSADLYKGDEPTAEKLDEISNMLAESWAHHRDHGCCSSKMQMTYNKEVNVKPGDIDNDVQILEHHVEEEGDEEEEDEEEDEDEEEEEQEEEEFDISVPSTSGCYGY